MRPMNPAAPELSFFDTNVIAYAYDKADPFKQARAKALMDAAMRAESFVISTQVMQELYNLVLRKRWITPLQAAQLLHHLAGYSVVPSSADAVLRAVGLQQRHTLSVWDALIVQAALDARCAVLYSEDLQAGRRFASAPGVATELRIVNPFDPSGDAPSLAVHETPKTDKVAAKKPRASRAS